MRASEPTWWYEGAPPWTIALLEPLARVWAAAAERRYRKGAQVDPGLPVVCVGNFTAGGTGKTPLALWIARSLSESGDAPAFLSRGYGGRHAGPHWVAPDSDRAGEVGDEPLLLARSAPTMVARDRAAGAARIAAGRQPDGRSFSVIVMDDGLQNGALAKTLSLAVVDARRGVGNGHVIPAGPLRAPLSFQLDLADAVVVNRPDDGAKDESGFIGWLRQSFHGPVIMATTRPRGDTAWLKDTPVVAYCGIGAPQRFFRLLEHLGAQIVERRAFGDHHVYATRDVHHLMALAERHDAALVTTEKDWVRLDHDGEMGRLKGRSQCVGIAMDFDERDTTRLKGLLEASLRGRRSVRL